MHTQKNGTIASADGQLIAFARIGDGSPIVVCHGAFTTADHWLGFGQAMAGSHSVYLYDRRGRAGSSDTGAAYSFDREVEDLAAMIELAGPGSIVLGHSFGGGCALALALRGGFDGTLVLYEPMHSTRAPISRGLRPELERLIEAEDLEQALQFALERIVFLSPQEMDVLQGSPLWAPMVEMVPLFPRELEGLDGIILEDRKHPSIGANVRLLLGELSPQDPNAIVCAEIVERLPGVTLRSLPGQGHVAHLADPEGLAREVAAVL